MASPAHYDTFEAAELFCLSCKQARRVRKTLLLITSTGRKYEYHCAVCATSVGFKTDNDTTEFNTLERGEVG